jgi:hypothetical protein
MQTEESLTEAEDLLEAIERQLGAAELSQQF